MSETFNRNAIHLWASIFAWVMFVLVSCSAVSLHAQGGAPLKLAQTIPLANVQGRLDHFAYDAAGDRLFVCALGNNSLEILDVRKGERIHSITGLGAPQGVGYIPGADRLFVANDEKGVCKIYDGKSFRQLLEINLGDDADNVRYDEIGKRIYVGFGNGGLAIVDATTGKQTGTITLSAHPEAFALEKNGSRIFVNVPNGRHVAVVDRIQGKVIATWSTEWAFANFPIALDEVNHRLFVGCRMPPKLLVLNTESGQIVDKVEIPGDVDDLFYDAKRHRVYAVCGAGKIGIIEQKDPNHYHLANNVDSAAGARTGLFVPGMDMLFVAVPHRGSQPAEIRAYRLQ
jgi:DNA-binding beta-propeller fold protein YncE